MKESAKKAQYPKKLFSLVSTVMSHLSEKGRNLTTTARVCSVLNVRRVGQDQKVFGHWAHQQSDSWTLR